MNGADVGRPDPIRAESIGSRLSRAWEPGAAHASSSPSSARAIAGDARRQPSIGSRPSAPEPLPFSLAVDPDDDTRGVVAMLDFFFPVGTPGRDEAFQLLMTLQPFERERAMNAIGRVALGARLDALKGYLASPPPVVTPTPAPAPVVYLPVQRGPRGPIIMTPQPPQKAPQTCVVNGFDPRWGAPPGDWKNVALQFDATIGAYRFDLRWALLHSPQDAFGNPLYSAFDFRKAKDNYGWQLWLQPYRNNVSSPWEFRWIRAVATSQVQCF